MAKHFKEEPQASGKASGAFLPIILLLLVIAACALGIWILDPLDWREAVGLARSTAILATFAMA